MPSDPSEMAQKLAGVLGESVVPFQPGDGDGAGGGDDGGTEDVPDRPEIELPRRGRSLERFAHELGGEMRHVMHRHEGRNVVISEEGDLEMMEAQAFRTFVNRRVTTVAHQVDKDGNSYTVEATMTRDMAMGALAGFSFYEQLPVLKGVNRVPMPVWRGPREDRSMELLEPGYDRETGFFTTAGIDFQRELPLKDGTRRLRSLHEEFEFVDSGRSLAVQMAAMLSMFVRPLLRRGSLPPAFIYDANKPGTGKSLLAKIAICPVYGVAPPTAYRRSEEFNDLLNTTVLSGVPMIFLDNIKHRLDNATLEAFLTAPLWTFRPKHGNEMVTVEKNTVIFITANQCEVSPDLARRALTVKQFSDEADIQAREIKNPIYDHMLGDLEFRSRLLAALWAMVRDWAAAGAPLSRSRPLKGFEEWSQIVGGIVEHAGFDDPLQPLAVDEAIDRDTSDLRQLVTLMADDWRENDDMDWGPGERIQPGRKSREYSREDVVGLCRANALFQAFLGADDEEAKEIRGGKIRFGKFLAARVGQLHTLEDGRRVCFGKRGDRHRKWSVEVL